MDMIAIGEGPLVTVAVPGDGTLRRHPRQRDVLRLTAVLVCLLPAVVAATVLGNLLDGSFVSVLVLVVIAAICTAIAADAWARASFARFSAQLLDDGLMVRRGVFWRSETFVPRTRIQHTEVNQGPLDRHWGMAKVIVFTAGTQLNSVGVSGLYHPEALVLRDTLL
jgi:membrane protein YdbS with pleckstrin-like domain